jgi:antitoxin (DNA-binding transcriptional repressor) of toxin-antitoxin stability system
MKIFRPILLGALIIALTVAPSYAKWIQGNYGSDGGGGGGTVYSVNSKTGTVVLTITDIAASLSMSGNDLVVTNGGIQVTGGSAGLTFSGTNAAIDGFTGYLSLEDGYVCIGDTCTNDFMDGDGDLLVEDDLEVNGTIHADGSVSSITFTGTNATIDGYTGYLTVEDGYTHFGDTISTTCSAIADGDGDVCVEDELAVGLFFYRPIAIVVADTGSSQGDGALIKSGYVSISTCANAGDAITLPGAVAGRSVVITNHGANSADIFPSSSDSINEAAVNTAKALAADATLMCYAYDSTNWECLTLAR